ncbi:MAG: hypothetical protein ABR980_10960 [Ignavibacteriaceae bacterium]|jgi:hypothetical protein
MDFNPLHFFATKYLLIILVLVILVSSSSFPQQSRLYKAINYISTFISSDYFNELKKTNNDLALADTIYLRMLKYENYDYLNTLFELTFAVIPYNKVHVRIPLINSVVVYRLPCAPDSIYRKKNNNLPRRFFFDTPTDNYGDKDKLAHFFGSAYISYAQSIFDIGYFIGYFVEVFEEDFEVQDPIDQRDLQTNNLGNIFGEMLKKDKNILPSQVMIIRSLLFLRFNL